MAKSIKPQAKKKVQPKAKASKNSEAKAVKSKAEAKPKAEPKAKAEPKPKKEVLPLTTFKDVKIINTEATEEKIYVEFEVPTSDGTFVERHVGEGDKKKSFYGNITYYRNPTQEQADAGNPMTLINRHNDFTRTQKRVVREFGTEFIRNIKKQERENAKAAQEKAKAEKKANAKSSPKPKAEKENAKAPTPKAKTPVAKKSGTKAKASPKKKPVAKKK